jgi:hypothetical protein
MRNAYRILIGSSERKRPLGRIILKHILKQQGMMCELDSSGS